MQDNPYGNFWNMLHGDADERKAPVWLLGKVLTVSPLVIQSGGQSLTGTDLLVNIQLLEHKREMTQTSISGSLQGDPGVSIADGDVSSTARHHGMLAPGDQVLLLPSPDMQTFAVVCKLASGEES